MKRTGKVICAMIVLLQSVAAVSGNSRSLRKWGNLRKYEGEQALLQSLRL